MVHGRRAVGRRLGGVLLGALLATLVGWTPGFVQPALAAGTLGVRAETRYTVDPADGRVHVVSRYTLTNNKPDTASLIYWYRDINIAVQPDIRAARATDGSGSLGVTTRQRKDYTEVQVRLRANLYYKKTTSFTLRYDLVGAKARSDAPTRVGDAFATFGIWAFGDNNRSEVEVRFPKGFTVTLQGDEMAQTGGAGSGTVLRAEPDDATEFFAIASAENREAYQESRVSLPGGVEIVVLAWPEDDAWRKSVSKTLEDGVPELQESIGLDWPVLRDLTVWERYTPTLEGYAGVFLAGQSRIDMSEDLDPLTTLHEASHAWFNHSLFEERWIYEGLAEEYAFRVNAAIGGDADLEPAEPDPDDDGFVRLNSWRFPAIVRDETDAIETYGYGAAWWVMHAIVEEAGVERMRAAFQAAEANDTAYPGAGSPEKVGVGDPWRRFLDLTQPIEEDDPEVVLDAIEAFVLASGDQDVLDKRAAARDGYRELLAAGDDWLPPWYVRGPMGEWRFDDATARMAEAAGVLALRDQVETAAATESLALDDGLEQAYEGAQDSLDGAKKLATDQIAAIAAIAEARGKVDAQPDLVSQVGLIGATPRVPYEAARAAFESGDVVAAVAQAGEAAAIIGRAPALGQERLLVGGGIVVGLLVLLVVAWLLLRRRRRRVVVAHAHARPAGATHAEAVSNAAVDARLGPTLGGQPDGPPAPIGEAPSDREGAEPL